MSDWLQYVPLIVIAVTICATCYRIGKIDGRQDERKFWMQRRQGYRKIILDRPLTSAFKIYRVEEDSPSPPPVV